MIATSRLCVAAIACLLVCSLSLTASQETERAQLIVHKQLISELPGLFAQGHAINVSIALYNVGTGPAYQVHVGDNWGDLFEIEGENSTLVEEIAPKESFHLNFTVTPQREGHFTGGAAQVTYQPTPESDPQQAFSSGYRSFTIYPPQTYDRFVTSKVVPWTITGVLFTLAIAAPLLAWAFIQTNYEHGIPISYKVKTA